MAVETAGASRMAENGKEDSQGKVTESISSLRNSLSGVFTNKFEKMHDDLTKIISQVENTADFVDTSTEHIQELYNKYNKLQEEGKDQEAEKISKQIQSIESIKETMDGSFKDLSEKVLNREELDEKEATELINSLKSVTEDVQSLGDSESISGNVRDVLNQYLETIGDERFGSEYRRELVSGLTDYLKEQGLGEYADTGQMEKFAEGTDDIGSEELSNIQDTLMDTQKSLKNLEALNTLVEQNKKLLENSEQNSEENIRQLNQMAEELSSSDSENARQIGEQLRETIGDSTRLSRDQLSEVRAMTSELEDMPNEIGQDFASNINKLVSETETNAEKQAKYLSTMADRLKETGRAEDANIAQQIKSTLQEAQAQTERKRSEDIQSIANSLKESNETVKKEFGQEIQRVVGDSSSLDEEQLNKLEEISTKFENQGEVSREVSELQKTMQSSVRLDQEQAKKMDNMVQEVSSDQTEIETLESLKELNSNFEDSTMNRQELRQSMMTGQKGGLEETLKNAPGLVSGAGGGMGAGAISAAMNAAGLGQLDAAFGISDAAAGALGSAATAGGAKAWRGAKKGAGALGRGAKGLAGRAGGRGAGRAAGSLAGKSKGLLSGAGRLAAKAGPAIGGMLGSGALAAGAGVAGAGAAGWGIGSLINETDFFQKEGRGGKEAMQSMFDFFTGGDQASRDQEAKDLESGDKEKQSQVVSSEFGKIKSELKGEGLFNSFSAEDLRSIVRDASAKLYNAPMKDRPRLAQQMVDKLSNLKNSMDLSPEQTDAINAAIEKFKQTKTAFTKMNGGKVEGKAEGESGEMKTAPNMPGASKDTPGKPKAEAQSKPEVMETGTTKMRRDQEREREEANRQAQKDQADKVERAARAAGGGGGGKTGDKGSPPVRRTSLNDDGLAVLNVVLDSQ